MICGGHAGRAHLKQLKALAKKKTFTDQFKDKFRKKFPRVDAGCGCLSDMFWQKTRNNFSDILSSSETAKEFFERLQDLVNHVQDVQEWEDGQCKFHALKVCSCGDCENKNEPKCKGRDYHTREILTFHSTYLFTRLSAM